MASFKRDWSYASSALPESINLLESSKSTSYSSLPKKIDKFGPSGSFKVLNQISFAGGVALSWNNVCVSSPERLTGCGKKKTVIPEVNILKNVSGYAQPGTIMAIMGASGAGKTTLLNTLTMRGTRGLSVTGEILLGGEDLGDDINFFSGYVQQEDVFIGSLTVKEHLLFQSKLWMDPELTDDERQIAVEDILIEVGLKKCENTIIGVPGLIKGLSGGEKKRLSFATQLLKAPLVLFADEPTTGLDSFMAESVVKSMENLARRGRTIICTIHQPSSQIYALFKQITLIGEGRVVYTGPTSDVAEFFASAGHPMPSIFNPADYFILSLAIMPGQEQECRKRVQEIWQTYQESPQQRELQYKLAGSMVPTGVDLINKSYQGKSDQDQRILRMMSNQLNVLEKQRFQSRYYTQFFWLFWRCAIDLTRNTKLLRTRIIVLLYAGIFLGVIYFRQRYDQTGVTNINGALFILMLECTFSPTFGVAQIFINEFAVFKREYKDKTYSVAPFFLAKVASVTPIYVVGVILFCSTSYWLIGLNYTFSTFVLFTTILILNAMVGTAFGHLSSSISENSAIGFALLPFILGLSMFFSGFLLKQGSSGPFVTTLQVLQYISPLRWTYEALLINQWRNVDYIDCSFTGVANGTIDSSACLNNGYEVIRSFGYNPDELIVCFLSNIGIFLSVELISFLFLLRKIRNAS